MTMNTQLSPPKVFIGFDAMLYNDNFGISTQVVNELRLSGFPTISDERILFGHAELKSRRSAPTIVCVWDGSGATGAMPLREYPVPGSVNIQPIAPTIATDLMRLSWHCWGVGAPQSPAADATAARFLAHTVWRVCYIKAAGSVFIEGIEVDPESATDQGVHCILRTVWHTPVLEKLMSYVPPGLVASITVSADGEVAAVIKTKGLTE